MVPWWHYALVYGASLLALLAGTLCHVFQRMDYNDGLSIFRWTPEAFALWLIGVVILILGLTGHVE